MINGFRKMGNGTSQYFFLTSSLLSRQVILIDLRDFDFLTLSYGEGLSIARAIFIYKSINNLLIHSFNFSFKSSFHNHNTRSKHNIRTSIASRRWGHWTTLNFAADTWNALNITLRETSTLAAFKRGLTKAKF